MKKVLTILLLLCVVFAQAQPQLPSYLPSNGLVGWWPFNGNAKDESGNGNNGTVNGATLTTDRNGSVGKAYSFYTSNGGGNIQLSGLSLGDKFSISCWVRLNEFNSTNVSSIISRYPSSGVGYELNIDNPAGLRGIYGLIGPESDSKNSIISKNQFNLNVWGQIVWIKNGSYSAIYKNGVIVYETNSANITGPNSGITYFGRAQWGGNPFKGVIDDIAIYNRVLSQDEITALYTGKPAGCFADIINKDTTICKGASVKLTATGEGGSLNAKDVDGNVYPAVNIGAQTWTQKNLNVTRYRNGDIIPQVTDPTQWLNLKTGAWCYWNNDQSTEPTYGKLYNWYAVNDPRGLAPEGWKVANSNDWNVMVDYLGGPSVAGGKIKETGTAHFVSPNLGATNISGFTALPAGVRMGIGESSPGQFYGMPFDGVFWTSTPIDVSLAQSRAVTAFIESTFEMNDHKTRGASVRVMKSNSYTYLWSNGATTPTMDVSPTQTTKYYVTVSDGINSCRDSVTVTVNDCSAPCIADIINKDTTICRGASVKLTATPNNVQPKIPVPSTLWLVGNINGWNNSASLETKYQLSKIGETTFAGIFNFQGGGSYKLIRELGNWNTQYRAIVDGNPLSGQFEQSNNDPGFQEPFIPGWYRVTVDFQTATYTVTPSTERVETPANLYIVGTLNGWNNSPSLDPKYTFTKADQFKYTLDVDFAEGGLYKLIQDLGNWSTQFHRNSGDALFGEFVQRDADPAFLNPETPGRYRITVDFAANYYWLKKITTGGSIPTNGLVGYWPFNGNANDESGNGNNGTVNGATLTMDRFGNSARAYMFQSSNISVPMTSLLHNLPIRSFSVWFYADGTQTGGRIYETTYLNGGIALYNGNILDAWYYNGQYEANVVNVNTGELNKWHHIVYVANSNTGLGQIFLDGVLTASRNGATLSPPAPQNWQNNFMRFGIGASGESYNGRIDDIRIYNRALTPNEITALYTEGNALTYLWSTGATTPTIDVSPTQTTKYYVTVSDGINSCTDSVTVTVTQPVTPSFTQIAPVCQGTTFTLPTTSNNNIKGTWAPAINTQTTTTYTFTPDPGQCANTTTMTVTVNNLNTAGAGSSTPTLCVNTPLTNITHATTRATGIGAATGLPAGVTAAWANNTITISGTPTASGTFNYTIPLTGGCGTVSATGRITVSSRVTPSFTQVAPVCQGTTFTLPTTSTNGVTGTWSPAINTQTTTTYTFTPSQGQCANTATMRVEIKSCNPLTLTISNVNGICGNTVDVPVSVAGFKSIVSMQGSINWNPADLKYELISNYGPASLALGIGNFGLSQTTQGRLTFSWNDANVAGITLPDNTPIYTIRFTALGNQTATKPITISNTPTPIEFVDATLQKKDIVQVNGSVIQKCVSIISGRILTPAQQPVKNATVSRSGSGTPTTATTDANGNYSFSVVPGSYTLTPSKNNEINRTNGVSTLDIALIQSHVLQRNLLNSPYKIIAADVNGTNTVTSLDLLFIRRFILGYQSSFPGNRTWAFVPQDQVFANPLNPFPYPASKTVSALNDAPNTNFIGLKLGDVNYDRNPQLDRPINGTQPLRLYYEEENINDNETILHVRAKEGRMLMGTQFTLNWDAGKYNFGGVVSNQLGISTGDNWQSEGVLALSWNDEKAQGVMLTKDMELFSIRLTRNANISQNASTDILSLGTDKLEQEAFDASYNNMGIVLERKLSSDEIITDKRMRIYPNPAVSKITVDAAVNYTGKGEIRLLDVLGRVVYTKVVDVRSGNNVYNLQLPRGKVKSGTYVVKLITGTEQQVGKIVVE